MTQTLDLTIPPALAELSTLRAAIARLFDASTWSELGRDALDLELAVHEILTNVIRHAAPTGDVSVYLAHLGDRVEVVVADDGTPLDTRELPTVSPGELREGGYGLHLARRLVDRISYVRTADGNRWRLSKELSA